MQKTQKLIDSDRVDLFVGYIWSNVLLGSLKPAMDKQDLPDQHQRRSVADCRRTLLALCLLDVLEQRPEAAAVGPYLNQKGLKTRS